MKKLLYGLCALLMVFFVASCDGKKGGDDEKENTEKSSKKKKKKNKKNKDAKESSKDENEDYDDNDEIFVDVDEDDDTVEFEEYEEDDDDVSNVSSSDLKNLLKSTARCDKWSVDEWVSWYRKTMNGLASFIKSNPSKSEYLQIKELAQFDENISDDAKRNMRAAEKILQKDEAFMKKMEEIGEGIEKLDKMYDD